MVRRHHDDARAGRDARAGESIDVTARVYHTEYGTVHTEGETYAVTDRALAETLRAIGFVSIDGWTDGQPITTPAIASLSPDTVALGAADFDVHVLGSGFGLDSVIVFNGHDEPTTITDDGDVSTGVDMSVWQTPATVPVQVRSGGNLSNEKMFTFTAARRADAGQTTPGRPPARAEIIHDDRRDR
jgi:hypothetical protein